MTQVILDANLAQQLNSLGTPVELCDPAGNVVGKFVPLVDLSVWEPITPDITEEEFQRRVNSNEPCYTTAEVLAHLENL